MKTQKVETKYGPLEVIEDDHIGKIILAGSYYEEEYINIVLSNNHKRRKTAVDIGANIGTWSLVLSKNFNQVYSFEPQPEVFKILSRNAAKNNVNLMETAIGHRGGYTNMQLDKAGNNCGGLPISNIGTEVKITRLDDLGIGEVDFIKMDVEGAEKLVFFGAQKTILKNRPFIFFEHTNINGFMEKNFIEEKELARFNIFEFLFADCGYDRIIKFKSNYLAIP